jgi:hypothetical protein
MENMNRDIEETSSKLKDNPKHGQIFATIAGIETPSVWMEFFKVVDPKNLRESLAFDRGGSPLKKLGIGTVTWEKLKPGDIITNKRRIYKTSKSSIIYLTNNEDTNEDEGAGKYFTIKTASEKGGYLYATMYMSSIFRHALNISDSIKHSGSAPGKTELWLDKHIQDWNAWFTIIQPNQYEEESNKP